MNKTLIRILLAVSLVITAILLIIAGYIAFILINLNQSYEIITEEYGEIIVKKEIVSDFPDYIYDIEISDKKNNKILAISIDDSSDNIKLIYNENSVCYLIADKYLIYKDKEDIFKYIEKSDFNNIDVKDFYFLVPFAIDLFERDFDWARAVTEFLIKSDNTETIGKMKEYSKGNFTEELVKNYITSHNQKQDIIYFFSRTLRHYNIS